MKKSILFSALIITAIFMAGCHSAKNVPYLQGAGEPIVFDSTKQTPHMYDARIMPKDLLTITVSATDPEVVQPFNLTVPSKTSGLSTTSQAQLQPYLVDNDGQINFPVIGFITVKGLTKRQAELRITDLLKQYVTAPPIVNVSFVNYKISVIGEVTRPNTFTISNDKVNIFEALAMAGDMTIWGRRDNVKIIREDEDGNKQVFLMNLNDKHIIFSPYFYLQQNDVVYVEPNETKAKNSEIGSATGLWISGISILISIAGLLVNVLRK